jgi:acetyl esterase/lipase
MKKFRSLPMVLLSLTVMSAYGSAAVGNLSVGPAENEAQAYGALSSFVCERLRLWPDLAPHETKADPGRFVYDAKGKAWRRRDVSRPELVLLRPKTEKKLDTLVIVVPGGGYDNQHMGSMPRNSLPVLESGRWVAMLHYRLPRRKGRAIYDAPREDMARAVRLLRAAGGRFGFSPEKIGAFGFSAGGHLAAIAAVSSQDRLYDPVDDIDKLPAHLNFAVPVYPAYVLSDGRDRPNANRGDGAAVLPEFKFDEKTPPMFLLHVDEDYFSSMASVRLYSELHRRKIPAQLFVFAKASHGLGSGVNVAGWQHRVLDWLVCMGY